MGRGLAPGCQTVLFHEELLSREAALSEAVESSQLIADPHRPNYLLHAQHGAGATTPLRRPVKLAPCPLLPGAFVATVQQTDAHWDNGCCVIPTGPPRPHTYHRSTTATWGWGSRHQAGLGGSDLQDNPKHLVSVKCLQIHTDSCMLKEVVLP